MNLDAEQTHRMRIMVREKHNVPHRHLFFNRVLEIVATTMRDLLLRLISGKVDVSDLDVATGA